MLLIFLFALSPVILYNYTTHESIFDTNAAWSMQYHVEIEPDTVDNWGSVPAYASALQSTLGDGGLQMLKKDSSTEIDNCMLSARQIYHNFMKSIDN